MGQHQLVEEGLGVGLKHDRHDVGALDVDVIDVLVSAGDSVALDDALITLESDKASMEVPAPFAGEVQQLLVEEGGSVSQGDPLMVVLAIAAPESPAEVAAAAAEPVALAAVEPVAPAQAAPIAPEAASPPAAAGGESVYAGPAVRKLAREFGIDLAKVSGSGPRGRVVKEDLHRFVQGALQERVPASAPAGAVGLPTIPEIDFSTFGEVEIVARSKVDKLTAANMQRSWLNVPHVTQFDEADITALEEFRASLKAEAESRGTKLTPMPFLLKACAAALRDNPKFNSSLVNAGEALAYLPRAVLQEDLVPGFQLQRPGHDVQTRAGVGHEDDFIPVRVQEIRHAGPGGGQPVAHVIEPEPALVDAYDDGYRRYRALYPAIKESLS